MYALKPRVHTTRGFDPRNSHDANDDAPLEFIPPSEEERLQIWQAIFTARNS